MFNIKSVHSNFYSHPRALRKSKCERERERKIIINTYNFKKIAQTLKHNGRCNRKIVVINERTSKRKFCEWITGCTAWMWYWMALYGVVG